MADRGLPRVGALLLAGLASLYLLDCPLHAILLRGLGEHPYATPFLDTRLITAQVQCRSRAIDVYARNPCDPLGRTQDYSPLWLRLSVLDRSDAWTPWFGLAIDLGSVARLAAIPWRVAGARGVPFGLVRL